MKDDLAQLYSLRQRLRHLGEPRVAPSTPYVQACQPSLARLQALVGGELLGNRPGDEACLIKRYTFALDHRHGGHILAEALEAAPDTLSLLARDPDLGRTSLAEAAFLDIETTGLAGGTGTLVFLVGIGKFTADSFEITQLFLPGPDEEHSFLQALKEELLQRPFLVSYNGKCFDAPMIQTRFLLKRQRLSLNAWPHLDLLYATRRLYRARVSDCSLSTVESQVLRVQRSQEDIPGALIPGIYFDYLQSGKVEPLTRVFYHNLVDILSLATLSGAITGTIEGRHITHPWDELGAGRILESAGRLEEAVAAYRRAADGNRGRHRYWALERLGFVLKRAGKYGQAEEVWRLLIDAKADASGSAHIELAKCLEHHKRDYAGAVEVVRAALELPATQESSLREALKYRLARLEGKLAQASRQQGAV
ncbi:MAG: ribonuclease H-like domain-containing protein [Anaerolineae bacterium]